MPKSPLSRVLLSLSVATLALSACQVREKTDKPLSGGGLNPPWDSPAFTPKALEGYVYAGPESLFAVFPAIARLDSQFGDRSAWKPDEKAIDTLRLRHLLDTGFAFPASPEAAMAYAYDDSYRDDTLFRNAYAHGLFTQDHPCAVTWVLSGSFLHPAKWLKAGLKQADVVGALGRPTYWQGDTADAVLRYLARYPEGGAPAEPSDEDADTAVNAGAAPREIYEGANFYFQADSLFAAVLQRSQPCH